MDIPQNYFPAMHAAGQEKTEEEKPEEEKAEEEKAGQGK